nr:hypothetical protein [Streptomyces noursei]
MDRSLYLTRDWAEDDERRTLVHVPDELVFTTKPQLAAAMLTQAHVLLPDHHDHGSG